MIWILQLLFSPLPTPALIGLITFGTTIFLWLITKPKPIVMPVDLNNQSIGTEVKEMLSLFISEFCVSSPPNVAFPLKLSGFFQGSDHSGDLVWYWLYLSTKSEKHELRLVMGF